jgi:short-subunit dehydrogenase
MEIRNRRVLITGGSSGIGLALAQVLGLKGAHVAISGRQADRLDAAIASLRAAGVAAKPIVADVATEWGRAATVEGALEALGGLDVLVNNAGGVRAGRLENTTEAEIRAMIEVDLVAPILLTQALLPSLRESGDSAVVNVASGIALIGMPFYTTYAAVKAGLARFGEALRRELSAEGIHVLTAYPGATETPMMQSSRAVAVADAICSGLEENEFEVIRGGEARAQMIALNRNDPAALDRRFAGIKAALEQAVRDHSAL